MLAALVRPPPRLTLVASDFHLGQGRDPLTGRCDPRENFLADDTFERLLRYYRSDAAEGALLLLNGDTFDFIRVLRNPRSKQDFRMWAERLARVGDGARASRLLELTEVEDDRWVRRRRAVVSRREEWLGLRADDFKTVWKLHIIARGHETFFQALADWLEGNGLLLFTKGNHDIELYWPLVHRAVREEIISRIPAADDDLYARIAFANRGFTMANLYIEHGHRFESMTAVLGGDVLEDNPSELNMPLGSFINRYFLNRIELLDPLIDNIEPTHHALLQLFRQRPLLMAATYPGACRFAWRALRVRKGRAAARAVRRLWTVLLLPPAAVLLYAAYWIWRDAFLPYPWWTVTIASFALFLLPASLPYLLGIWESVARRFARKPPRDLLTEGARRMLARCFPSPGRPKRVYAVLGHRHAQEVRSVAAFGAGPAEKSGSTEETGPVKRDGGPEEGTGPSEAICVISGTWIPHWPLLRPDMRGHVDYSYLEFRLEENGEYRHRSLRWDDEAGEPRVPNHRHHGAR